MENQQSIQEQYLADIKQIIEENIDNESFSVADLAREVGLSRSMLHRKLIRLTGKSATDLITEIRLAKAYELLENDAGTVSEIAYQVGYSSPSYFNKVFKKTYKVSAGDVRRKGSGKVSHLRVIKESRNPGSARSKRSRSNVIAGANILLIIIVIVGVVSFIILNFIQRTGKKEILDKSVAVLPFINDSQDKENEHFINGIMEDLVVNLQTIKELRVPGRNSTEKYRNSPKTIPGMAKEMNVAYIVEGRGQRYGDRIRLRVQLVEGATDKHIWADSFDEVIQHLGIRKEYVEKELDNVDLLLG